MASQPTTPCPCGSGLAADMCCSLDLAARPAGSPPAEVQATAAEAAQALAAGRREDAARLAIAALSAHPTAPGALGVLYTVRKEEGAHAAADALLRRLVAVDPNNVAATCDLALHLFTRNDLDQALAHARNAVRLAPRHAQSHNLMGMIMTEANRPRVGEHHYREALKLVGPDPILLANLAWNLRNQGRMDEARELYAESVRLKPDIFQTLLGWARTEEADREFAKAGEILDRAEALSLGNPGVLLTRAVIAGRTRDYAGAVALLDAIAERQGRLGPAELLEKGRLFDKMGRTDEAFAAYEEGKTSYRDLSGHAWLGQHAEDMARRLKGFFTAQRLKILPRAGVREDMAQPLFIVGFMRSGTTMVEQTLSAHPKISAGDELPFITDLVQIMPRMLASPLAYPEALADLWMGDQLEGLDNLRDYYLQRTRQLGIIRHGSRWFTDKMPLNETHLGLISMVFPELPVIHLLRHPLDVVLSVFANHMTHGVYCSYALETAARHYALTMDLIEHYKRELSLKYLPVRYEDIVDDQEAQVRRMLEFVGEAFDPRCITFHENRRYARTASYAQVSERLYDSSRFRYRHYLKHLAPVIPILEPVIARLGYTIEGPPGEQQPAAAPRPAAPAPAVKSPPPARRRPASARKRPAASS